MHSRSRCAGIENVGVSSSTTLPAGNSKAADRSQLSPSAIRRRTGVDDERAADSGRTTSGLSSLSRPPNRSPPGASQVNRKLWTAQRAVALAEEGLRTAPARRNDSVKLPVEQSKVRSPRRLLGVLNRSAHTVYPQAGHPSFVTMYSTFSSRCSRFRQPPTASQFAKCKSASRWFPRRSFRASRRGARGPGGVSHNSPRPLGRPDLCGSPPATRCWRSGLRAWGHTRRSEPSKAPTARRRAAGGRQPSGRGNGLTHGISVGALCALWLPAQSSRPLRACEMTKNVHQRREVLDVVQIILQLHHRIPGNREMPHVNLLQPVMPGLTLSRCG